MSYKTRAYKIVSIIMLLLLIFQAGAVYADELQITESVNNKAVVFMLDASNSMNTNDKNRLAIDSISQMIYSLPSDYDVAVVAYNTQVIVSTEILDVNARADAVNAVNAVNYSGFTNAGDGLSTAVNTLANHEATEKTIIILSDGEIIMGSSEETAASQTLFQDAIQLAAEMGITIHVVGLGSELSSSEANIYSAAEESDGVIKQIATVTDVPDAIETILVEQLGVKKSTGALIEASGGVDTLSVTLPYQHASRLRILLTSTGTIQNLITDFHAENAQQVNGTYYAFIDIQNPSLDIINFQLQGQTGSQVKVDIFPEYSVIVNAQQISDGRIEVDTPTNQIFEITFYDAAKQNQMVFTDTLFENCSVDITANGQELTSILNEGRLTFELPITESQLMTMSFDFSQLPVNILYKDNSTTLDVIIETITPRDIRPYIVCVVVCIVIIIAIIALLLSRKRKESTPSSANKAEPLAEPVSPYSFSGKLSIYITKTASGYDIEPLSYNLFRISSGRTVTLKSILDGCGVEEALEGADKILFRPGANRTLILTNQSDCTILRNRELLLKDGSYELQINAKVDITFEDAYSELVFHFKDML